MVATQSDPQPHCGMLPLAIYYYYAYYYAVFCLHQNCWEIRCSVEPKITPVYRERKFKNCTCRALKQCLRSSVLPLMLQKRPDGSRSRCNTGWLPVASILRRFLRTLLKISLKDDSLQSAEKLAMDITLLMELRHVLERWPCSVHKWWRKIVREDNFFIINRRLQAFLITASECALKFSLWSTAVPR